MQYFVIWHDGQKFGPADVATLNQWIVEGRVLPTTELENASSGARLAAASVPGIVFPQGATPGSENIFAADYQPTEQEIEQVVKATAPPHRPLGASPPGASPYPRGSGQASMEGGDSDATKGWIFSILGVCCCIFTILGIYFGVQANRKGHPQGTAIIIVAVVIFLGSGVLSFMLNPGVMDLISGGPR